MFRKKVAIGILLISTIIIASIYSNSVFKISTHITLAQHLSENPLKLDKVPEAWGKLLKEYPEIAKRIQDNRGVYYRYSNTVNEETFPNLSEQAKALNNAIRSLQVAEITQAINYLEPFYNSYPERFYKVYRLLDKMPLPDSVPGTREGKIIYALIRYNRAVALLKLSDIHYNSKTERNKNLRFAIFNLRRAVGTFEVMGYLKNKIPDIEKYLPVHQAYTTLATAYLRIKDASGYPEESTYYLKTMWKRYSCGDTIVGSRVCESIDLYMNNRGKNVFFYRLIHALQNLEVSSRIIKNKQDAAFAYMYGLITKHLGVMGTSPIKEETLKEAYSYLQVAVTKDKAADGKIRYAALKEQVLIDIELQNYDRVIKTLKDQYPIDLQNTTPDKYKQNEFLFMDFIQFRNFCSGQLDNVIEYTTRYRDTMSQSPEVQEFYEKNMNILAENFFSELSERFREMEKAKKIPEIGSILDDLHQNYLSKEIFYLSHGKEWLHLSLLMRMNRFLHQSKPAYYTVFFLKWFLAPLLLLYFVLFIKLHRNMAMRIVSSDY
ncbi:MAG: hypothetical protein GY795_20985 [Desulfobacterales bacterium]|nr:hypothetical protein [Desulfobacterales bacterium]